MDYEKKYKEALERANVAHKNEDRLLKATLERIFPELKVSVDDCIEKIKKDIISYLNNRKIESIAESSATEKWIDLIKNQNPINNKEDEEVRQYIIRTMKQKDINVPMVQKSLAWLEKQGKERKITYEEICKSYNIPDIGEFSDGYHTFNGLYKQRMILFAVLVKTYKDKAWKSWKHEDGLDCFGGGWFIVGIDTPAGTYTYHYEAKDWDRFDCQILEKAKHWDGHSESDVERLFSLVSNVNKDEVEQGKQKPIDEIKLGKKYKCIASPRYTMFMVGEIYKPEDEFLCSLMNLCSDCFESVEDGRIKI